MKDKPREDRIIDVNNRGEIILPIGHFAIFNLKSMKNCHPKIVINGLGSCIALIMIDKANKICGMSHILLPSYNELYYNAPLRYPHKYADLAVSDLIEQLENEGAKRVNLKAIIIGGAKIFQNHQNNIGSENIQMIKNELKRFNIDIMSEFTGGNKGRSVIFKTKTISVLLRETHQEKYEKIY